MLTSWLTGLVIASVPPSLAMTSFQMLRGVASWSIWLRSLKDWQVSVRPPDSLVDVSPDLLDIICSSEHCHDPRARFNVVWQLFTCEDLCIKKFVSKCLGLKFPNSLLTEDRLLFQGNSAWLYQQSDPRDDCERLFLKIFYGQGRDLVFRNLDNLLSAFQMRLFPLWTFMPANGDIFSLWSESVIEDYFSPEKDLRGFEEASRDSLNWWRLVSS